jgi:hypothetical protein
MGIKLSDIARHTKTIKVGFEGTDEQLTVVTNPNAMTPRKEAAFQAAAKTDDDAGDATLGMLSTVLVRWDLVDDDGQQIPVSVEGLRDVPNPIILAVLRAMSKENAADPTK